MSEKTEPLDPKILEQHIADALPSMVAGALDKTRLEVLNLIGLAQRSHVDTLCADDFATIAVKLALRLSDRDRPSKGGRSFRLPVIAGGNLERFAMMVMGMLPKPLLNALDCADPNAYDLVTGDWNRDIDISPLFNPPNR